MARFEAGNFRLNTVRLQSEMSVKLLDKALDQQGQMAMTLLQTLPAVSAAGTGKIVDILA